MLQKRPVASRPAGAPRSFRSKAWWRSPEPCRPAVPRILERIRLEVWWSSAAGRRTLQLVAYRGARMTADDVPFFEAMQEGGTAAQAR